VISEQVGDFGIDLGLIADDRSVPCLWKEAIRMPVALPDPLDDVISPVFELLPMKRAMTALVPKQGASPEVVALIEAVVADARLDGHDGVKAGLWLYADELDRGHAICQDMASPSGSFWHAIVHRREADFSNARYWYHKAGAHPAMNCIDIAGGTAAGSNMAGYDAARFVDRAERASQRSESDSPDLIALQHHEWRALFEWCAEH